MFSVGNISRHGILFFVFCPRKKTAFRFLRNIRLLPERRPEDSADSLFFRHRTEIRFLTAVFDSREGLLVGAAVAEFSVEYAVAVEIYAKISELRAQYSFGFSEEFVVRLVFRLDVPPRKTGIRRLPATFRGRAALTRAYESADDVRVYIERDGVRVYIERPVVFAIIHAEKRKVAVEILSDRVFLIRIRFFPTLILIVAIFPPFALLVSSDRRPRVLKRVRN